MKQHLNTILICLAIIIGLGILANGYKYKFTSSETVSVTGLSEKDFTSNLIVWGGSFSRTAMDLKDAYATLKQDESAIKAYLNSKGIVDSCIVFSSVSMMKNFQRQYDERGNEIRADFSGYTLTGRFISYVNTRI